MTIKEFNRLPVEAQMSIVGKILDLNEAIEQYAIDLAIKEQPYPGMNIQKAVDAKGLHLGNKTYMRTVDYTQASPISAPKTSK